MSAIPEDVKKRVIELKKEGKNHRTIARVTGVSVGSVSNITSGITGFVSLKASPVEVESDERNGDERTITKVINKRIKTLDELIEACEIDTSEWEIYKWRCTAWQTGMKSKETDAAFYSQQFSVSASMRLRKVLIAAASELSELRSKAVKHTAGYITKLGSLSNPKSGNVLEISLYDHHFGALIWGKETGGADYDSKIAKNCWEKALSSLVTKAAHLKFDRALLVLGNDQQNVDNRAGTTERGTPQNSDGRYQKMFEISREASIWAIDSLSAVASAVDVIVISGNHDALAAWHLGDSLTSWYRQAKNIRVDNSPLFRKYFHHGAVMLMFTHGAAKRKLEDYGNVMAAERPDMWGVTRWREAHTGDKHHRELVEKTGVAVRILPSLRPPCSWSSENMYIGAMRAAESYYWNSQEGLIGTGVYSILEK